MTKQASSIPTVSAYEVVPKDETSDDDSSYPFATVELNELSQVVVDRTHRVPEEHVAYLGPAAKDLFWEDDFFEDEQFSNKNVVAVFDLDYDVMEYHYSTLSWTCLGVTSCCFPGVIPWLLIGFVPCYVNRNVSWNVRAQHIALTKEGVLFVHEKRQVCWGNSCKAPQESTLIRYDEIAECRIEDEANGCDILCKQKPSRVTLGKTGTSKKHKNSIHHNDFKIVGLKEPQAFKKLFTVLKHNFRPTSPCPITEMDRALEGVVSSQSQNQEDVATLLRQIRDELRKNNEAIQAAALSP